MDSWITEAPKYSSFRVNSLKEINLNILKNFLETKTKLKCNEIPNYYLLRNDCLIVEHWPHDLAIETTGTEVIVDAFCAAAVLRGANVYAPGILGFPTSCKLNDKVDIYGDLDGQCKRGLKVKYNGRKMFVGTGLVKMMRHELFDNGVQPSGIAIETLLPISRVPVVNETLYPNGEVVLQNLPSIVCGWVMNPQPFENILDMCAAPGNKTTHLAEMSHDKANIIAIDKTPQKVAKIKENCKVQGVTCVDAFVFDSTKCHSETATSDNSPPFPANYFDKVLLDAPCSGLGQRPQLVNRMTPSMINSYKPIQRKLFAAAVNVLKENGKLVYSTCTTTEGENEGMVVWALEKFPCLNLIPAEPLLGGPGLPNKGLNDEQSGIAIETLLPISRVLVVNETLYPNGEVVLQNLPSIVCGWVMNPQPFENILDMCAAPGCNLVYSTCTITEGKNEGMVVTLEKFPCLKLVPAEPLLGGPGLPNKSLNDEQRIMVERFGPEDDPLRPVEDLYKGSIGFFIATFVKIP